MKAPDRPSSKMSKATLAPKSGMSVKLYFQQNWRRDVRVFQTDHQTEFRKFSKQLKQVLKLRDNQNIVIKWQDDTGDLITISSDSEMQLATKHIRHTDTLNIIVQLLEEVSSPTLCDKCDQTIICNIRYKCDKCANFVCCVRCYQSAHNKPSIHEHELYKEKYPCYCPMHRTSETDVHTFPPDRPLSAVPPHLMHQPGDSHRGRSSSLPNGIQGNYHGHQGYQGHHGNQHHYPSNGYHRSSSMGPGGQYSNSNSMEDLMMRGLNPTCPDLLPDDYDNNYRTAERREVLSGPEGQVYKQQQMSVFQNPESGVVAIRSRRSRETRSKTQQLG